MISRRMVLSGASALIATGAVSAQAQTPALEQILLWQGKAPGGGGTTGPEKLGDKGGAKGAVSNISVPRLRVYRPAVPNGKAVIICGGGGYFRIQLRKESTPAAKWLQQRGYTAFELIYRLPADGWDASAPFIDAQRALKIVRTRAADFSLDPNKIGIMGMSAGGHLAGFTALQPSRALYAGQDQYEAASARPDFAALLFPVVSLRKPYDTTRTRKEIIGTKPSTSAQNAWSLDSYAAKDAPPMILFSAADDAITPPGHNIALFEALTKAGASAELHIFANGGHGWGLGKPTENLSQWPELFNNWTDRVVFTQ